MPPVVLRSILAVLTPDPGYYSEIDCQVVPMHAAPAPDWVRASQVFARNEVEVSAKIWLHIFYSCDDGQALNVMGMANCGP